MTTEVKKTLSWVLHTHDGIFTDVYTEDGLKHTETVSENYYQFATTTTAAYSHPYCRFMLTVMHREHWDNFSC